MKTISASSFCASKTDLKLWQAKLKINFFAKFFFCKNCIGRESKSEKCTPSALIFFARAISFPTMIFRERGRARAAIFLAKISRSFLSKSYSRMMIAEFFGKDFIVASRLEILLRSEKKTLLGSPDFLLFISNFFISNKIF